MGTRADFYVGRGEKAEWLGSIAWDGHPETVLPDIEKAKTPRQFRKLVSKLLCSRDDGTLPGMGWPWPWDNSHLTDYSYAFDKQIWTSCFGYPWMTVVEAKDPDRSDTEGDEKTTVFPDMKDRKAVALGKRSGVMLFR